MRETFDPVSLLDEQSKSIFYPQIAPWSPETEEAMDEDLDDCLLGSECSYSNQPRRFSTCNLDRGDVVDDPIGIILNIDTDGQVENPVKEELKEEINSAMVRNYYNIAKFQSRRVILPPRVHLPIAVAGETWFSARDPLMMFRKKKNQERDGNV